jgi:hypothetical protein|tara:strand:- start:107 stop:415 length:309 start_codon:yes stop_codon:yes gene_type:complete
MSSWIAITFFFAGISILAWIFYAAYALPLFKDAYPEEFRSCGSPSMIWIGDGTFFAYLVRNKHRRLSDPFIVRILDRLKWIHLFSHLCLAAFGLTLVAGLAA